MLTFFVFVNTINKYLHIFAHVQVVLEFYNQLKIKIKCKILSIYHSVAPFIYIVSVRHHTYIVGGRAAKKKKQTNKWKEKGLDMHAH